MRICLDKVGEEGQKSLGRELHDEVFWGYLLGRNVEVFKVPDLKERDSKMNNAAKLKGVSNSTRSDEPASKQ